MKPNKTPKEKAEEIIKKYIDEMPCLVEQTGKSIMKHAKESTLICVNEIIKQWEYIDTYISDLDGDISKNLKYWEDVKQEIMKKK